MMLYMMAKRHEDLPSPHQLGDIIRLQNVTVMMKNDQPVLKMNLFNQSVSWCLFYQDYKSFFEHN